MTLSAAGCDSDVAIVKDREGAPIWAEVMRMRVNRAGASPVHQRYFQV